nr:NADH dehydrogenase subunit 4L [Halipeurus diversus]
MLTALICMEMVMISILMIILMCNSLWDCSYLIITFVCFLVCEGTIGLSITSSINKVKCDEFLFKCSSTVN